MTFLFAEGFIVPHGTVNGTVMVLKRKVDNVTSSIRGTVSHELEMSYKNDAYAATRQVYRFSY